MNRQSPMGTYQPRLTPAIKGLLIAMLAGFVIQLALTRLTDVATFQTFGFSPAAFFLKGWLWQGVTYPFLHGGLWHLMLNGVVLFMFGSELELRWGTKRFLQYFFVCALGGALVQSLVWAVAIFVAPEQSAELGAVPIVGASGAVYGLFTAFSRLFGDRQILFMFILPLKARNFVYILAGIAIFSAITNGNEGVAHLVHLGGLLTGYVFLVTRGPFLDGLGGRSPLSFFRRRKTMSREEVRSRLRVIQTPADDKDGKFPKHWN